MKSSRHLEHAVLGGRSLDGAHFAMMTCYFDESIEQWSDKDGKSREFTFVCGYAASANQWETFEIDWKLYLEKYQVSAFCMADYSQSVGEYAKWKEKEWEPIRARFIIDGAEIVRGIARHGFISVLADSIFESMNAKYKLKESCGSPYGVVGRVCADLARSWRLRTHHAANELEYVFEDGCPDKCGLMRAMENLFPSLPSPIFKPGKNRNPTKECPDGRRAIIQLQATDYLAHEVRKMLADQMKTLPDGSIRSVRQSLAALTPIPTAKEMLTDVSLERFCVRSKMESRN